MDKRTRERLQRVAAHAYALGKLMGRADARWTTRPEIEAVAQHVLEEGVPSQGYLYLADERKTAIWRYNFYLGWQFANGASDACKEPTIVLEQEEE
jgi:DNA invertase Pin-like site-specific DNA recombinase